MSSFAKRVLCAICALTLFVAFGDSALALRTHEQLVGEEPNTTAILHGACCMTGLAVEQAGGDLYALDQYDPTSFAWGLIHRFHSDGSYDQAFDEATLAFSETTSEPQDVAVDDSATASKGRIYVADSAHNRVDAIDSTGALVSAFGTEGRINGAEDVPGDPDTIPTGGFSHPCGLAVDPASGDLLVADQNANKVWIFDSTGAYRGKVADSSLNGPCGLAFDSKGNLYVRNANDGRVLRFTRASATDYEFGSVFYNAAEGGATDVAVDTADDHVFVDRGDRVVEYEEGGGLVSTFGQGVLDGGGKGIAVDSGSGHVYVADNSSIHAFGPLVTLPDATTGAASAVTDTTATIAGTVDPAGGPEASCVFEYGTQGSYGQSAPCEPSGPYAGAQAVQANLTGLSAVTTYHYRLHSTSSEGVSNGADATFTTAGTPRVINSWVTAVTIETATFNAKIAPSGAETSYRFEYTTDALYREAGFAGATSVPLLPGELLAGAGEQTVAQAVTGLAPGTTYDFRVVATNFVGTTEGAVKSFTTFAPPAPAQVDNCPNARYRTGPSAVLPNCRAYEMVSPVDKNGSGVYAAGANSTLASASGERVQFLSHVGVGEDFQGSGYEGISQYVASRGPDGWSSKDIVPTPTFNAPLQVFAAITRVWDLSEEFDRATLSGYSLPGVEGGTPEADNVYLEDTVNSKLLAAVTNASQESALPFSPPFFLLIPTVGGSSADMETVTFQSPRDLTPGTSGIVPKIYAYERGAVKLVGVLPDGSIPAGGSELARGVVGYANYRSPGAIAHKDTVSRDGSKILFVSPAFNNGQQLYMRKNGSETVMISQSEASVPTVAEEVYLQAATPDDKEILFTTTSRLTDTDPGGAGPALYMYTDGPRPETESNLTYVTHLPNLESVGRGGGEDKVIKGISQDGNRFYFLDNGFMFIWDKGQIRLVSKAPSEEIENPAKLTEASVSSDGRRIVFESRKKITQDDTVEFDKEPTRAGNSRRNVELYMYDEVSEKVTCVSCPPTGAAVTLGVETEVEASAGGAEFVMSGQARFFSHDGRYVFFNTKEALLPQDTNGVTDAYEYDVETGKLSLLSTGTGRDGTWFVDASADGRNAFLVTAQKLTESDLDSLIDVYDARVDGGLPGPQLRPAPCAGDACQGVPSAAPNFNTASDFNGLGNQSVVSSKGKASPSSTSRRLKRALAACRKKPRRRRAVCEATARGRYGARKSAKRAIRAGR